MSHWKGKYGPYLIAEIGGNHEGDFKYAQLLTQLACESGVDAVKLQIYTGDTIANKLVDPQRNEHFKKFELSQDQYKNLFQICQRYGVECTASVWDPDALTWVDPFVEFFKIGSGDLTAYPILKSIAKYDKPCLLSTGLATIDEIEGAVALMQSVNPMYSESSSLAILQCTSMYPIPDEDANLNVMNSLRSRFSHPVGYSDHTIGSLAVEVAVAMGAEIIEMHFTDSRDGKSFRDHKVSFTKDEIKSLIERIIKIKELQGDSNKEPTKSEIEAGHVASFRRAVYPNRSIAAGEILAEDDLITLRPNKGIDARDAQKLIGKTVGTNLKQFQELGYEYFE